MFDSALTMEPQISAICRSCGLHIHNIGKIVRYLTPRATELLVHAFITSRLDSCNALLHGLPDDQVRRLQLIQNTAARLVTRTRKHEHITPVLRRLHWLPVRERIDYKILLLAFKGLHGLAPRYLAELLVQNRPHKALRSTSANKLVVPRTFLKTYGDRAFCYAAPKLWNSLPLHLRPCDSLVSVKAGLNTFLFKRAFGL